VSHFGTAASRAQPRRVRASVRLTTDGLPELVGKNHSLHAVADAELGEDSVDMRLHRCG